MADFYFVVLTLQLWSEQETHLGLPMAVKMDDGSVAYLPVFETREQAESAYPGHRVLWITSSEKEPDHA